VHRKAIGGASAVKAVGIEQLTDIELQRMRERD